MKQFISLLPGLLIAGYVLFALLQTDLLGILVYGMLVMFGQIALI